MGQLVSRKLRGCATLSPESWKGTFVMEVKREATPRLLFPSLWFFTPGANDFMKHTFAFRVCMFLWGRLISCP